MNEFYILLLGMASGSIIGFIGVYIGVRTFKSAVNPFLDLTPVESLNTIEEDSIYSSSTGELDWDYGNMINSMDEPTNEK